MKGRSWQNKQKYFYFFTKQILEAVAGDLL